MPVYEYECRDHGVFDQHRGMAEYASPGRCPVCQGEAPRILSAPLLRRVGALERTARDRNERSAHEPRVVTRGEMPSSGAAPAGGARAVSASTGGYPWAVGH